VAEVFGNSPDFKQKSWETLAVYGGVSINPQMQKSCFEQFLIATLEIIGLAFTKCLAT